jgi:hypothetical protein
MCQGGLFPSYRLKVTSKSEASLKSKGQGRSYLWTVWLIRDDPIGIHPAPSPTRQPCDDKPGELHMGPGLCKWPKSSLVPPNSILQALAQLDPQWYLECKSWSSNLRQVACSFGDLASSRWSLSLTKSKQFVSIKKMSVQVLQWNRNETWWAPPGPRPSEKFEVVLPFITDGCKHHYMVSQGNWIVKSLNSQG